MLSPISGVSSSKCYSGCRDILSVLVLKNIYFGVSLVQTDSAKSAVFLYISTLTN